MLIVTGVSGQLGRRIVEGLLRLVPAEGIGVSLRDPGKVPDLVARGLRVRQGDYDDPDGLRHAFEGGSRLLLVSSNVAATGGNALEQHANAIAAAKAAGIGRVFYTSQVSANAASQFPPGRDHAATEALLAESGLPWTALRHGFYAASAMGMHGAGLRAGTVSAPADGKVAWISHGDLADVDARLLVADEVVDGPTVALTGGEALDLEALAAIAGDILGAPVARTLISEEALVSRARATPLPGAVIEILKGYYRAAEAGEFSEVTSEVERLLGRPPLSMARFLEHWLTGQASAMAGHERIVQGGE